MSRKLVCLAFLAAFQCSAGLQPIAATLGTASSSLSEEEAMQAAARALGYNGKYLISSFPDLRQVAYCRLPDNVFRPLVIGEVTTPSGVAVDSASLRLFLADPPDNMIYWYQLAIRPDGSLMSDGVQHIAIEGYKVNWMAVNSQGDLYFTGKQTVEAPESVYDAVYRVDAEQINIGVTDSPTEVYTRSNSGEPNPGVWMPSGIAVDSFSIYWGNQEEGNRYGSVVKGPRQNLATSQTSVARGALSLSVLYEEEQSVKGMTATNNLIFFLTTNGVYGVPKTRSGGSTNGLNNGLISGPPEQNGGNSWDPRSLAYDGDATMYFTDHLYGKIYSLPAVDTFPHSIQKFADTPDVFGITLLDTSNQSLGSRSSFSLATAMLLLVLLLVR